MVREHCTVPLSTPHLPPPLARAQLHEKVSLGLGAASHSSEPPGAAGRRTDSSKQLSVRADCAAKEEAESLPGAELCQSRHPRVPSGVQPVQLTRFGTYIKVAFNTSRFVWLWGMLGRRTGVCCGYISRTCFWAAGTLPSSLPPSSVLSACVTHTDGNNFFQLLEEVGEACSLHWGCFSLLLPLLFGFGCREPSL